MSSQAKKALLIVAVLLLAMTIFFIIEISRPAPEDKAVDLIKQLMGL